MREGSVWIVDDSAMEAEQAKRLLSDRYHLQVFLDGEALLDRLASSEGPDALLLDINLPGVSGLEVCKLLRTHHDELALPILMMTASTDADSLVQGLTVGANDFLRKPLEATELMARVSTMVRVRKLHRTLEASRRALQQRVAFEEQLVGIVSHDLRNPLQIVGMTAAMMKNQEPLNERMRVSLRRISDATDRANRMIRDLLDFTQARVSGRIPVERLTTDVETVVRQMVEESASVSPGRDIKLTVRGETTAEVDPDRISQVVGNLVSNALKYGATDQPVEVVCEGHPRDVEIQVRNQGPVIPPLLFPRLFEPMQRGVTGGENPGRSIGLGLFIVRELIRAHGGRVDVRSNPEEGTVFTLWVPRQAAEL